MPNRGLGKANGMKAEECISLTLPSNLCYLAAVQGLAEIPAGGAGFDEEARLDLGLAVREGAINAMKHGNALDPAKQVGVRFVTTAENFRVEIRDRGEGFKPEQMPDPTAPENIWRSSGRGLLLIRSLVNEVRFVRCRPGMKLLLTKRRPPRTAGEETS